MTATAAQLLDVFDAGRSACRAGWPATRCPYPDGDELRTFWLRGYVDARLTRAGWPR